MAISLKNHEDRITALENKQAVSAGDTGWQNCTEIKIKTYESMRLISRYRIKNSVLYIEARGRLESLGGVAFRIPNWSYGSFNFLSTSGTGDKGGYYEGKSFSIDDSGYVNVESIGYQWPVLNGLIITPLTI